MSKIKYTRKWLNPTDTSNSGYIQYSVHQDYGWVASFKMADCSRIINLDFYMDDKKKRKQSIKKAKIIRDSVQDFINQIEAIDNE